VAPVRRLAAIMFTDMVGSTASAQSNEAAALKLRDEQARLVRPVFTAHRGREIKSMGDGFLAEFDSARNAVQCAIDIQQQLHERNSREGAVRIELRIGIHLGDVERRKGDIFGDAVNIASRIESTADPGGLSISGPVFDQVRNKIPNRLEKLPPTPLKGLQTPIDIYRVVMPWNARGPPDGGDAAVGLAVLPFTNISPDPKDEYIADGLTEELITVVSSLRELRVISRTSAMLYKATPKSASQIGAELGVSALLEGSVRKAGNRLRITAQLIDARNDRHLWAQTFDREFDDVFAIQTEIAKRVADALRIELRTADEARLESRPTVSPESYLAYLRGLTLLRDTSAASLEAAQRQFEIAISLDPTNASAYGNLAIATWFFAIWHIDPSRTDWVEKLRASAARALELDPNNPDAHVGMTPVLFREQDYAGMEREFRLAISLNPSHALAHDQLAQILNFVGRTEEALVEFRLAEAADPLWLFNLYMHAGLLIQLRRLDEAWPIIEKIGAIAPSDPDLHWTLGQYYFARSETSKGLEEWRKNEALLPDGRLKQITRAWIVARSGETEKTRELLRHEGTQPLFGQIPTNIAQIYAEIGDLDQCFRWLDKSYLAHDLPIMVIRYDPRYENIRRDPRYQLLLKKMNLA
jgi:adenylate cyclase